MNVLGALGYAATGCLYLLVSALSVVSWNGGRIGGWLILACVVNAGWAALLGAESLGRAVPLVATTSAEFLRSGMWITFLLMLLGRLGMRRSLVAAGNAAWIAVLLAGVTAGMTGWRFDGQSGLAGVLIYGGLAVALLGLFFVEQLFRNSPSDTRWNVWPLVLGLGGIFAYDLFLYSQAVLFENLNPILWQARGTANALFVPLLAIAARRNTHWDIDIFVSRHVVFYSSTLVAVGIYLLLTSAGGYALLIYGGSWGGLAQVVFLVGAILVLVTLLFSSSLRARARVFLSKHFFRNKYDYREEWLRLISTLSGFDSSTSDQIVIKALAQIVASPSGYLWRMDPTAQEYRLIGAYRARPDLPNLSPEEPLVRFMRRHHWLVDLEEYARTPDLYENMPLPAWLEREPANWLIVPLMSRGDVLGLVLLTKAPGPLALNFEDRDLLKTVGNHVAVHLAQEQADNLLAEAQQFVAYNRLTAFLMHDLNNLIAQQSMIVRNAERHKRNPEFIDDAIQTIANSVSKMKRVMSRLKRGDDAPRLKKTLLKFLLSSAADRCGGRRPEPTLEIKESDIEVEVDVERFIMVLVHLINNAQDATPPGGRVHVKAQWRDGCIEIRVEDNGEGMSSDFIRDRLFRPFDSTKGSQGMGIGAFQAREFARSLGGDLKVESEPGRGTTFSLSFPTPR